MNLIENTGDIVQEPDWTSLFSDVMEVAAAHEHWRVLITELRERGLLSSANAHMVQRLVASYTVYDRATRQVAEHGAVVKPKKGSSRAIPRLSPYFTAMREANSDATALEAELGVSPRRRSSAGKAERKASLPRASDRYLKSVAK